MSLERRPWAALHDAVGVLRSQAAEPLLELCSSIPRGFCFQVPPALNVEIVFLLVEKATPFGYKLLIISSNFHEPHEMRKSCNDIQDQPL